MRVARQRRCHFNPMSKMHLSSDSMLVLFSSLQLYRSIEHVCTLNSEFHKKDLLVGTHDRGGVCIVYWVA